MIHGWVHIATIGAWEPILRELFDRLDRSGLRAATASVMLAVVGPEADLSWFPPWVELVQRDGPLEMGECSTLRALWEWSKSAGPGKVWYLHAKGASHPHDRHVADWLDYLCFFNITGWRDRSQALDTHDASGADWVSLTGDYQWALDLWHEQSHVPGSAGFTGNFWWATTSYLASLPAEKILPGRNRWDAEWLFIGAGNPRVECPHNARHNFYLGPYPRSRYDPGSAV